MSINPRSEANEKTFRSAKTNKFRFDAQLLLLDEQWVWKPFEIRNFKLWVISSYWDEAKAVGVADVGAEGKWRGRGCRHRHGEWRMANSNGEWQMANSNGEWRWRCWCGRGWRNGEKLCDRWKVFILTLQRGEARSNKSCASNRNLFVFADRKVFFHSLHT